MPSAANHREMSGEFHIAWRVVTLKMQNTCCISNSRQKMFATVHASYMQCPSCTWNLLHCWSNSQIFNRK